MVSDRQPVENWGPIIQRKDAEIARLREALLPFAHAAEVVVPQIDMLCGKGFYKHLENARSVLEDTKL